MESERVKAIQQGQIHYTSDRPCQYGHEPLRYTNSGGCVACTRERQRRKWTKTKELLATIPQ